MLYALTFALLFAPVAKGNGADMCVLTQVDFAGAGIQVQTKPKANLDDGGKSVYCSYRGRSGATGGVELDVFYPAGDTPEDVMQTFKTVMTENPAPAGYAQVTVPGAEESRVSLSIPSSGYKPYAAINVRRGDLVFTISLPTGPHAQQQLIHLSRTVLSRLAP